MEAGFPPVRVGPYRIIAPLGQGGMARVDLAVHESSGELCVLKQLHAELDRGGDATIRFIREAKLAGLLQHPNIARLHDSHVIDGKLYLASEFVAGVTFEDINRVIWADRARLSPRLAVQMILPVLRALDHAHRLRDEDGRPVGLVHRDLSSKNLMLGFDGGVKVIDFGVAKGAVDDHRTATGMLMGTPLYMSPEQASGERVDNRSDLYTVGVVLWELLVGRRLVQAKGRAHMLMSVVRDEAPRPSQAAPEVPPELDAVVARALSKEVEDRFSDAEAFVRALIPVTAEVGLVEPVELGHELRRLLPAREAEVSGWLNQAREAGERGTLLFEPLPPATKVAVDPRPAVDAPARTLAPPPASTGLDSRPAPHARRSSLVWVAPGLVLVALGVTAALLWAPASTSVVTEAAGPAAPVPTPTPDPLPAARSAERPAAGPVARPAAPKEDRVEPPAPEPARRGPSSSSRRTPARPSKPGPEPTSPEPVDGPRAPAELRELLAEYRRRYDMDAAAQLYRRLQGQARSASPSIVNCLEGPLAGLESVKFEEVDVAAPFFASALRCLAR